MVRMNEEADWLAALFSPFPLLVLMRKMLSRRVRRITFCLYPLQDALSIDWAGVL